MKNLKKILSMVLATMMVMSLMVVGAGAAFTDEETIENTEAVEVVSALNIIGGYPDGTFKGEKSVSRAEMAKMICVALNGGEDPTLGVKDVPTYTDVRNSSDAWAEAYIEYCTNLGIVSGVGDGKFVPSRTVTGTEAAKMMLVALGYDSDIFGFTGADWAVNVNVQANGVNTKLYDGLAASTANAPLTRDEAAQMIYNMLEAETMAKTYDKVINNGEIAYKYAPSGRSFLNEYYSAYTFIGTYMGDTNSLNLAYDGMIRVHGRLDTENTGDRDATFYSDMDISNIGEEVKIIFKDGKGGTVDAPDRKDTIFGVYNTGNTQVVYTTQGKIGNQKSADAKINVDGTKYDTLNSVKVVTNFAGTGTSTVANNGSTAANSSLTTALKGINGNAIKLVFNDQNKVTAAYMLDTKIGYITSVTSTKVGISGVGTIEIAKNAIYDGVAVNDIVTYTQMYNTTNKDKAVFVVELAEAVSGEMTGFKIDNDGKYNNVALDGTNYTFYSATATAPTSLPPVSVGDASSVASVNSDNIGSDFTAYLVNGYVGYLFEGEDSASSIALLTEHNNGVLGATIDAPKAALLKADGTEVVASLNKNSVLYNAGTELASGQNISAAITSGDPTFVRYAETSAGVYKVIEIVTGGAYTLNGTWSVANNGDIYDTDTKTVNGTVTASNCVLYATNDNGDIKAYSIRDLNDIKNTTGASITVKYVVKDGYVVAVYAPLSARPSGAAGSMVYGIVSGYTGTRKVDGSYYHVYTVSNDVEKYTVSLDEDSAKNIVVGKLVGFEPAADGIYNDGDVAIYDGSAWNHTNGLAVYVKNFNSADGTIRYWTALSGGEPDDSTLTVKALDADCAIVYVNAKDDKAGENIGVGAYNPDNDYKNALLIRDSNDDKVVAIFVETSDKCDINA